MLAGVRAALVPARLSEHVAAHAPGWAGFRLMRCIEKRSSPRANHKFVYMITTKALILWRRVVENSPWLINRRSGGALRDWVLEWDMTRYP